MAKKPKDQVKVVRVPHGIFGRANTNKIAKAIEKWANKGFVLDQQHDSKGAYGGYTLLTFIKTAEPD